MAIRDGYGYITVVTDLSPWDLDTGTPLAIIHGLSITEWKTIKDMQITVINNAGTAMYDFVAGDGSGVAGRITVSSSLFDITRTTGQVFDAAGFNAATATFIYRYLTD